MDRRRGVKSAPPLTPWRRSRWYSSVLRSPRSTSWPVHALAAACSFARRRRRRLTCERCASTGAKTQRAAANYAERLRTGRVANIWSARSRLRDTGLVAWSPRRPSRNSITSTRGHRTQRPYITRAGKPGSSTIRQAVERLTRMWNWMSRMSQYSGDLRSMTPKSSDALTHRRCASLALRTQARADLSLRPSADDGVL